MEEDLLNYLPTVMFGGTRCMFITEDIRSPIENMF